MISDTETYTETHSPPPRVDSRRGAGRWRDWDGSPAGMGFPALPAAARRRIEIARGGTRKKRRGCARFFFPSLLLFFLLVPGVPGVEGELGAARLSGPRQPSLHPAAGNRWARRRPRGGAGFLACGAAGFDHPRALRRPNLDRRKLGGAATRSWLRLASIRSDTRSRTRSLSRCRWRRGVGIPTGLPGAVQGPHSATSEQAARSSEDHSRTRECGMVQG